MGGFIVPQMPPQLIEALKRQQSAPQGPMGGMPVNGRTPVPMPGVPPPMGPLPTATPPIRMGPGGVNLNPPPTPPPGTLPGMNIPGAPMPAGAKLPPVTDDPAVAKMGEMPQRTDLSQYLAPALQRYQSDMSGYQQADQANRIDPNNVKPKLWERLLGFGLGLTQLKNPENAGVVAGEVVNRRRTNAEQRRDTAMAPWRERLQVDKEGMPIATAAADAAHRQATLDLDTSKENRERFTAQSNAEAHDELNQIRKEYDEGRIEGQTDRLNELAEKNKSDIELRTKILDLREQMLKDKEGKSNQGSRSQFAGAEAKKASALQKAKTAYDRATELAGPDPEARRTADENFKQAEQDAQDAYEAEVNALGGDASHSPVESWRGQGGKPATAPTGAPATTAVARPAEQTLPLVVGPAGEKPIKTGTGEDGKTKYGYYASTKQWMIVPPQGGK